MIFPAIVLISVAKTFLAVSSLLKQHHLVAGLAVGVVGLAVAGFASPGRRQVPVVGGTAVAARALHTGGAAAPSRHWITGAVGLGAAVALW